MRKPSIVILILLAGAGAYFAGPLITAWNIREAVKNKNVTYLETHIKWTPVKATLKESLKKLSFEPDKDFETETVNEDTDLWTQTKSYLGKSIIDTFVERYATPSTLPTLFSFGKTIRRNILGRADPEDKMSILERIAYVWKRVKRAQFLSLTRFEMHMADKYEPQRIYAGILTFENFAWRLEELRVRFDKKTDTSSKQFVLSKLAHHQTATLSNKPR